MNRPTMADVAKAAAVSPKSVSRVVNNEPNVSPVLREKVEAAIAALGFVPDLAARSLAGARTRTVTVLFDAFPLDNPPPYAAIVQAGAYEACRNHGYHLRLERIDFAKGHLAQQLAELHRAFRADGLILSGGISDTAEIMDWLESKAIPYVRIDPFEDVGRAPYVSIDEQAAAGAVAHHLWELGHRRFGLVNGIEYHGSTQTRRQGFLNSLECLGNSNVQEVSGNSSFEHAIAAGKQLMSGANPPTGIFAANDVLAAGVMAGVSQLGFKVPEDVSVVGFDDNMVAKLVWPYLTTVRQPVADLAFTAAMLLLHRLARVDVSNLPKLETPLIVRGSTAPPNWGRGQAAHAMVSL